MYEDYINQTQIEKKKDKKGRRGYTWVL
uniref:Uncharacterized protein n=1 Tax=Rhizophora mucronata TaxID=61149 RepID=A0A2P2KIH4_RHIMU